ncbi:MAG: putative toxin-antitoxin system toxin component, PIN family [Bryobacteraceae bacterium]
MAGVTLDSNIYVSALEFGGIGARLLGMGRAGNIRIDVSDAILDEVVTVLRDDFHWPGYRLHFARENLAKIGNLVVPAQAVDVIREDPDDNRILECAVTAGSDFIVTYDKDLLRLGVYGSITIVTAADFLQRALLR